MECRGGLTMEEGAMMTMTESTNVPFGGVGKGDGDCDGDGDGNSDSGGNATINKCCRRQWNGRGAYHGEGGNDDDDGIDERPVWAVMGMARATSTVVAAVERWPPPLQWQW